MYIISAHDEGGNPPLYTNVTFVPSYVISYFSTEIYVLKLYKSGEVCGKGRGRAGGGGRQRGMEGWKKQLKAGGERHRGKHG